MTREHTPRPGLTWEAFVAAAERPVNDADWSDDGLTADANRAARRAAKRATARKRPTMKPVTEPPLDLDVVLRERVDRMRDGWADGRHRDK